VQVISNAILLLATLSPALAQEAEPKTLTLEQASARAKAPRFSGRAGDFSWAPDGHHLVLGRGKDAKWLDPETLERVDPRPLGKPEPLEDRPDREKVAAALEAIEGIDAEGAKQIARRRRAASEDGNRWLMESEGALYFYGRDEDGKERVGSVPAADGPFELPQVAPEGPLMGWVKGNDLYLLNTVDGSLIQVTEDGGPDRLNGKLDWVYQEEIYGRGDFQAFWLSPTGSHVAFLSLDESPVEEFTVVDHVEEGHFRVKPEITHYPKVGDPNPIVALGIAETRRGQIRWIDLERYESEEPLVVRVDWTPDGRCLFMVQDRIQTWCDVNVADPDTGEWQTLIHEASPTWVDRPRSPRWLEDGSFLWLSQRTGYRHLYHYAADGKLVRPVTAGEWAVRRMREVDEEVGLIYFTATEGGAVNVNHYRVQLDGGGFKRLTRGDGSHSIDFREDKQFLIDRVSGLMFPEEVRLCDADGDLIELLGRAEIPAEKEGYPLARWELTEVDARDGFPLDVALLKPVPFDEKRPHPVWVMTYSGPDAPSVRNRWNGSTWAQFLAQNGVIVLQANVRSASGKSHVATGACYKRMLIPEIADLEDVVGWLTAKPWADARRVGITGYSYGGSVSAFALLTSDKFALGIAGGGVYDWRMYDTIYTERYMSTPDRNKEGYEATSCLNKAEGLKGFLHLYHGVMDDNVHVQNMLQLAMFLQRAGKTSWSMMAYPQNRHGISNGGQRWHARQLEWQLIQEHLKPVTALDREKERVEEMFDEAVGGAGGEGK